MAVWSATEKSSSITLTGSGLIATHNGGAGDNAMGRSDEAITTGDKKYWEQVVNLDYLQSTGGGICNTSETFPTGRWPGLTDDSIGIYPAGEAYHNYEGTSTTLLTGLPTFTTGDRLCFAVDFANKKLWYRVGNGNWNGSGTDNPATNTGGISFSSLIGTGDVYPVVNVYTPNGQSTANFGATSFTHTPPSGFTGFDTAGTTYTLTADAGSYTVTGTANTFLHSKRVTADPGSYTITGTDALFSDNPQVLSAAGATYAITGTDATLIGPDEVGMAHKKFDSVQQIVTGTGTGNLLLGSATGAKYRTLQAAGLADGDSVYVRIQHASIDAEWEDVLVTRSGGSLVRTFNAHSSSATGSLINFTAGNKYVSTTLLADQVVTVDPNGDALIERDIVIGRQLRMAVDFETALQTAFTEDRVLNWLGGDVVITSPIVLQATTGKYGFGLRGNGMKIESNFNDATKYAITLEVPVVAGSVPSNVNVRNFVFQDILFSGITPFKGAIELRCLSNASWINSFTLSNLVCETHTDYAYRWTGSVFECRGDALKSTGGVGGLYIERADNALNGDFGLPSAMELNYPNFRDGSGNGITMACRIAFTEPFDLSVKGGYIVTMGGIAIDAPAGITLVDNLGIEYMNGGWGMLIGYRGGVLKGGTRGANPVANADDSPPVGMRYLFEWWAASGKLVVEDLHYENEGVGTNMTLGKVGGSGTVYMNRSGTSAALDNSGCTIIVQTA